MTSVLRTKSPSTLLRQLWRHLTLHRKRQFFILLCLMLFSAMAEVVSLGDVLPFIGMLTGPEWVFNHALVSEVALTWGITSADQLLLPLTIGFSTAVLLAGCTRKLLLLASTFFAITSGSELSIEVYSRILYQFNK
jgi:ATP-binding cassette, subfamily B, bacterial PglK